LGRINFINHSKRGLDIVISIIGLLAAAPFFLIIGALIKIESNGPILFKQSRIGLNGNLFMMLKFRSMIDNAEQQGTGLFSYSDDCRVTKVGRILRNTSLDELPQLLNVLKGDMSLVGPRPPVHYELGNYENFDSVLKNRFVVRPGITGLSQISGRNDLTWTEKIKLDNLYIQQLYSMGIYYDVLIMLKTIIVVMRGRGVIEERINEMD
jgi:lipopolysaccharide/colanic/teichoic acid biosynthesis glycosyltransferase